MNNKEYFKFIIKLITPYKVKILLLTILMFISGVGNMIMPLLQKLIIDEGIVRQNQTLLVRLIIYTILAYIAISLLVFMQNLIQIEINNDFNKSMQLKAIGHLLRIKKDYLEKEGVLKLAKNADYCVDSLSRITGSTVLQILLEIFKLFGIVIALMFINWKLALFSLSYIPIKLIVTAITSKYAQKYSNENIKKHQSLHKWEEDTFSTVPEIKLWNLYDIKNIEYKKHLDKIFELVRKISLLQIKDMLFGEVLSHLIFNVLYLIAGVLIWKNELTVGGLTVVISYFAYVQEPVALFSTLKIMFSNIKPAVDKFEEFMNLPEEKKMNTILEPMLQSQENVELKVCNVYFAYDNKLILDDISLSIKKGEKVALIGENGAGKTTLIDLLLRFITPMKGSILINGISIDDYSVDTYRDCFGVVTQAPNLFNASIRDNLTVFDKYKLDEKIIRSPIFNFINNMSKGINSEVGSKAAMLSGGEKQKIALARALIKDPCILILDEPTSNYDADSKKKFINLIKDVESAAILISHDKDVLMEVDKIILLNNGKLMIFNSYQEYKDSNNFLF